MLKLSFTRNFVSGFLSSAVNLKKIDTRQYLINSTMIGQKKISSFFTSPRSDRSDDKKAKSEIPNKRHVEESECTVENQNASKRAKVDVNENCETTRDTSVLSENDGSFNRSLNEEERSKIEDNPMTAKMKMTTTKTRGLVTNIDLSWYKALEPEFSKPYFSDLASFVEEERKKYTVFPAATDVFAWTRMAPIQKTKVVILGQDPYHGINQAHGLCFSVQKGVALPPSLENMFKELSSDIEGFIHPKHGCLSGWAEQGVLLLNAVLTVRAHNANSHKDRGWEKFTDAVVSYLNKNSSGIVFMLWGTYAQKKGSQIDKKRHHIIQGVHPSPLSAHRGFFGSKHFSRCNELLRQQGKAAIDWSYLP